uniref:NADP-dependent oxidoreductase domain-containing protein n=1 Tax=Scylla olivacea TaxID=85551 RepID=A0A0P4WES0_SCYOL
MDRGTVSYTSKVSVAGSDEKLPVLGVSTKMGMEPIKARRCFSRAVNRGVQLLDTAYSDMCEQELAKVLNLCWRRGDTRNEFFIITKLPLVGMKWNMVSRFLDISLKNLGLNYVDAFLMEAPVGLQYINDTEVRPVDEKGNCLLDMTTDLLEIWRHMEILLTSGRARMIGVSNFNIEQVECLINKARIPPAIAQLDINAYNMRSIERRLLSDLGVSVMAVYVTGNPLLDDSDKLPVLRKHPKVKEIARNHNVNSVCVLIKYLIQQHIVSLVKFTSVDELDKTFETIDSFTLTAADIGMLHSLDQGGDLRLRDFVDYKGCQNHPEFPFSYDARHPDVNPGKWKRSRNLLGTPPRYDFLDPNCPFPINEYDYRRLPSHPPQPYVTSSKTPLSITEENTPNVSSLKRPFCLIEGEAKNQEAHKKQNEKVTIQRSVCNLVSLVHEESPSQGTNMTPNIHLGQRDEADNTLPKIWAKGYISLTLTTEKGLFKDVPTHFSGEFQVPLKPEGSVKKDMPEETDYEDEHIGTEAVKGNHPLPNRIPSPRIPSTALAQRRSQAVTGQFRKETRHRMCREDEIPYQPYTKKCGCECPGCNKKNPASGNKKRQ